MRRIDLDHLRAGLIMHLKQHSKAAAAAATFTGMRKHEDGVEQVVGATLRYLEQMNYRVVAPSLVSRPPLASGHSWGPMPGRWGADEPEPGDEPA